MSIIKINLVFLFHCVYHPKRRWTNYPWNVQFTPFFMFSYTSWASECLQQTLPVDCCCHWSASVLPDDVSHLIAFITHTHTRIHIHTDTLVRGMKKKTMKMRRERFIEHALITKLFMQLYESESSLFSYQTIQLNT